MRVALFVTVFGLCSIPAGTAQSLPQFGGGGGANYVGYAFVDCTAASKPPVRLVLMQGVVPPTLPASAPRPSLAVILPGSPDSVAAKEVAVSKDPAGPGQMVSCPVVGACVPAETGTVTIEPRGADGTYKGQFKATWPPIPERQGKFNVAWRDSGKTCG